MLRFFLGEYIIMPTKGKSKAATRRTDNTRTKLNMTNRQNNGGQNIIEMYTEKAKTEQLESH